MPPGGHMLVSISEGIARCDYCGWSGPYSALGDSPCTYDYPPCERCGGTPECLPDCSAIFRGPRSGGVLRSIRVGCGPARGDEELASGRWPV